MRPLCWSESSLSSRRQLLVIAARRLPQEALVHYHWIMAFVGEIERSGGRAFAHSVRSVSDVDDFLQRRGPTAASSGGTVQLLFVASMSPRKRRYIRSRLEFSGKRTRRVTLRERHQLLRPDFLGSDRLPWQGLLFFALTSVIWVPLALLKRLILWSLGRGSRMYVAESKRGGVGTTGDDGSGPFGSGDREPRNPLTPLPAIGTYRLLP